MTVSDIVSIAGMIIIAAVALAVLIAT